MYIRADSFDRDTWSKISQLHNALFDYLGLDAEYDKYAREDAVFGIYDDVTSGKDVRDSFYSVFDVVYDTEIPEDIFEDYYQQIFG